jgi:hypothetical protein
LQEKNSISEVVKNHLPKKFLHYQNSKIRTGSSNLMGMGKSLFTVRYRATRNSSFK